MVDYKELGNLVILTREQIELKKIMNLGKLIDAAKENPDDGHYNLAFLEREYESRVQDMINSLNPQLLREYGLIKIKPIMELPKEEIYSSLVDIFKKENTLKLKIVNRCKKCGTAMSNNTLRTVCSDCFNLYVINKETYLKKW